jgi:ABC-type nitrate/sulfonate/bicarbonate transport system substrate-binding protein
MCARISVWQLIWIATTMFATASTTFAAENPLVRFAACGTCTAQGVEGLIIRQTNIPELVGLNINVLFLNPPQMGAGVASDSLDVEFVGAQPALAQLANNIPIRIVAFMYDFELRMEALPPIKSVAELKDKKIGVPFGTTAYKFASDIVLRNGIPTSALINVAPPDIGNALAGGQVAAGVIWDPLWGVIEKTQKTVPLERENHTGFTAMRAKFVEGERGAALRFLAAQILAVAFRGANVAEADKRYEAAFGVPVDVANAAQAIDRSRGWKSVEDVNLGLQEEDRQDLKRTMEFVVKEKLIPREVNIDAAIDASLIRDAHQFLTSNKISVSQVRYINNAK